jgi:hypothetical protein
LGSSDLKGGFMVKEARPGVKGVTHETYAKKLIPRTRRRLERTEPSRDV